MRRLSILLIALLFAFTATSPAQEWAKAALEKSPRHREYVKIKRGDRTITAFVVYPEFSEKTPVVLLIHEIFGLSDWAKEMADEIAAKGYIVIAPDLLSGYGPNGGGSEAFAGQDETVRAVSGLDPEGVLDDLNATADYGKKLPSSNGTLFVTGFCWGGGKSFAFATQRHDLAAAFVFYGPPPPQATMKDITTPVYGFYAGNDARITSTVSTTTDAMNQLGKKYDVVIYDGAGHGFMRAGEAPAASRDNRKARDEAFDRLIRLMGSNVAHH